MVFTIVLDVVVVALILYRQRRVRRIPPHLSLRLSVVLGVVGLIQLVGYAGSHHLSAAVVGVLTLSLVVGAVGMGAVRAVTVRIWRMGEAVLRQGTWLTIGLWAVSLGLHFGADWWIRALHGPTGVTIAGLLLWLGITYGVQRAVVHRRAEHLLALDGAIDAHADVVGGQGTSGGPGGGGGHWERWTGTSGPGSSRGWGTPASTGGPPAGGRRPQAIEAHAELVPRSTARPGGGDRNARRDGPSPTDGGRGTAEG